MSNPEYFTVMDQVVVYQNLFSEEELSFLIKIIKDSEEPVYEYDKDTHLKAAYYNDQGKQPERREDNSGIYTWTPWYDFGSKSIWGIPENQDEKNIQFVGYNILNSAIIKCKNFYLNKYSKIGKWVYDIDWNDKEDLTFSTLEILKHKKNIDTKYTIEPHTDWHNQREEEPGPKQILTFTIYLNDDYDGGEIDFVDEINKHLIVYKPKKGDLVVFPSGRPYWHGARAVTSDVSKYFIRTFLSYRYKGSERWIQGVLNHGLTLWIDLENKRIAEYIEEGNASRQVLWEGQSVSSNKNSLPLFINKETYIDGRLNA